MVVPPIFFHFLSLLDVVSRIYSVNDRMCYYCDYNSRIHTHRHLPLLYTFYTFYRKIEKNLNQFAYKCKGGSGEEEEDFYSSLASNRVLEGLYCGRFDLKVIMTIEY